MGQVGEQSLAPGLLVDRFADVGVEVAIGAFGDAERPVDIEGQILRFGRVHRPRPMAAADPGGKMRLAVLLLLAACSAAPEPGAEDQPARIVERRTNDAPAPRGAALLREAMLAGHNEARSRLGLPPLVWSDALAADARIYAEQMARTGR